MINIGTVKIDTHSKERALSTKYRALDNPEGVRILLGDYHALKILRFNGDTAASDILIDLETAIDGAGLTDRQRQVIRKVFAEDMSQVDTAHELRVSKQTINRLITVSLVKIARVYEFWARHSEGYSLTIETEEITA